MLRNEGGAYLVIFYSDSVLESTRSEFILVTALCVY